MFVFVGTILDELKHYACTQIAIFCHGVTAYPTPVATTPQGGQDSSPHPLYPGSIQHSILLPVISSFLCVAVLLLVVGLLCCRKHRGTEKNICVEQNRKYSFCHIEWLTKEENRRQHKSTENV